MAMVLNSEKRRKIVRTLLEYPRRQWSCTFLEQATRLSHPTVFRTLRELAGWGILRTFKVNKRDLVYELAARSPWAEELKKVITIETVTSRRIAYEIITKVKKKIVVAILYGSSVTGQMKSDSDIDLLLVVDHHNKKEEKIIYDTAAELSQKVNRSLAVLIMDRLEVKKEMTGQFLQSVRAGHEVLYGKTPF